MENREIIETIVSPVWGVELPKLRGSFPHARVKGRVITTRVVGVTFEGRQEVVARFQQGDRVWVEMQPTNPYDRNAIKVCRENGEMVGYLNRHLAASLNPYFKGYRYPVRGRVTLLTGGSYNGFPLACMISFKFPKQHQLTHTPQQNRVRRLGGLGSLDRRIV